MTVLQVSDVAASVAHYARLGFVHSGVWQEDEAPFFAIVQRGDVTLGLQLLLGPLRVDTHWAAYIYVSDVEALHAEFTAEGLAPSEIHHPEHYGCDDFDVVDPDGHRLAFGQARQPEPGPGLSTDRGRG